jgi:hypothetical protein
MPTVSFFEQYRRAGPPFYQEPDCGESRVPVRWGAHYGQLLATKRCTRYGKDKDVVSKVQFIQRIILDLAADHGSRRLTRGRSRSCDSPCAWFSLKVVVDDPAEWLHHRHGQIFSTPDKMVNDC